MKLDKHDLKFSVMRLPKKLKDIMMNSDWKDKVFIGGGFLRSIVSRDPINDIDIFCSSKENAEILTYKLAERKDNIIKTDNAYTIKEKTPLQIIHRWNFDTPEKVCDSFDFTICSSIIFFNFENKTWDSICDDRFYIDLAAKRLVYRSPIRNEDAGGSFLRVLKYYQKGYRIPLDSMGAVIARLVKEIDTNKVDLQEEKSVAKIITGLLREVDPDIDPFHAAHLPIINNEIN